MKMKMKNEKYKIVMSKFMGYGSTGSAKYEITFNNPLEHTGRFTGIEDGLNAYCKKERRKEIVEILKHLLCLLLNKNEKMKKSKKNNTEIISCPECGKKQKAMVKQTIPFYSFVHYCKKCKHIITESDWIN